MNNRDKLKAMTVEEFAGFLCDSMEKIAEKTEEFVCDICPVSKLCRKNHNGFITWLNSEAEEKQEGGLWYQ